MTDQELQDKQATLTACETELATIHAKQRDAIEAARQANAEYRALQTLSKKVSDALAPLREQIAAEVGERKKKALAAKVAQQQEAEKSELEKAHARIAELEAGRKK